MGLSPLCFAVLLMGCGARPAELVAVTPEVPGQLLTCAQSPAVPGPDATQRAVGIFVVDLHAAHRECRERLHAVGRILVQGWADLEVQGSRER